jgi:Zn-dependent protease with chaperone function
MNLKRIPEITIVPISPELNGFAFGNVGVFFYG